jgi:hypothetical protein
MVLLPKVKTHTLFTGPERSLAPRIQNYLQNTDKFARTSDSAGKNARQMNPFI